MNITAALNSAAEVLGNSGVAEPRREAASLLVHALSRENAFLIAHPEYELTTEEALAYQAAVSRRANREPFQYIIGKQEFFGLDFEVNSDVLIPRPETEILVEAGIDIISDIAQPMVCEIGVGSGCISVSLLNAVPNARGSGVDVSENALAVARRNAERHHVLDRLFLSCGDLFDGITDGPFDLIVSNPPYVPDEQLAQLQAEVRQFEPHTALSGGPGGLVIIELIVKGAAGFLVSGGYLLMEIGFDQSERVSQLFEHPRWRDVELLPDLQGIPRIIKAQIN